MARKMWINVYDSFAFHKKGSLEHPPKHFNVSLGMGHVLPVDDFLENMDESIPLETYDLIDPNLKKIALPMPVKMEQSIIRTNTGMTIECGDIAARKISLSDETEPGTYQVAATSKASFFTMYVDEKGEQNWTFKPLNEMNGVGNILFSSKVQYCAKAFLKVGNWTKPKPIGYVLELTPLTDLSDVHIGDPVSFEAIFMGKPFTCTTDTVEYMYAKSNTFGGEAGGDIEGFFLAAYIVNGRAQFRMPTAGQWLITVFAFKDVTLENDLKELADQCSKVYFTSTVTFNVRA